MKRVLRKLSMGMAVALILLGAIELGFRLLVATPDDVPLWIPAPRQDGSPETWRRSPIHVADPYLFWRNRPNVDTIFRGARVRTNEFGLRSAPITKAKPQNVLRILCLGESSTFGERVEQDETYAAVLESLLNARPNGTTHQVLNAGAPGYSIVQSFEYLRRHGLELEPDVILLYHGYNDFLPTRFVAERLATVDQDTAGLTDLELRDQQYRLANRVGTWLTTSSRALAWLRAKLTASEPPAQPVGETLAAAQSTSARVPAADRQTVLNDLRQLAAAHHATLVILVPCYLTFSEHRDLLVRFARDSATPILDLEGAVLRTGVERVRLFVDQVHPGPALHRAIAEEIFEFCRRDLASARAAPRK